MLPEFDDQANPAELARMLAVQAEMLALNAAIESARGGPRGAELAELAGQARQLAQCALDAVRRHEQLLLTEEAAGRVLDEGLAEGPIDGDLDDVIDVFGQHQTGLLLAAADRVERQVRLTH
ncbi:MAG: hypothetical protein NTV19_08650 [Burkholderiales bacterium]|nr:hypothetical protein [Burkholderiales bacterium]